MINDKTWEEFQKTGLLLFINQILHVFGWAIVYNLDDCGNLISVNPARVRFRGFDTKNVSDAYSNISHYLKENIDSLVKEADN